MKSNRIVVRSQLVAGKREVVSQEEVDDLQDFFTRLKDGPASMLPLEERDEIYRAGAFSAKFRAAYRVLESMIQKKLNNRIRTMKIKDWLDEGTDITRELLDMARRWEEPT